MRRAGLLALALVLVLGGAGSGRAGGSQSCRTPSALLVMASPLTYSAAKIANGGELTIVAVGSSSTEGIGASSAALTYPSRLQAELHERFPKMAIRVINRGKGGEDAPEELARFGRDVIAEDPDLVIWQIGTNAMLRRIDPASERAVLQRGIAQIKDSGSDVVLMDMQYAPAVVARADYATIQKVISEVAARNRVGLFRRFEIMRHWLAREEPGAVPVIGPDGLHMTDRSYACLAAGLAEALARNWQEAQGPLRSPASRVAKLGAAERSGDWAGDEP